jgi:periplasmic divalent cation tolerance protein
MSSDFSLFYTTFPDVPTAQKTSRILLEEKLVACTNLFPSTQSQYWWEGKIESSEECVLILKSQASLKRQLEKRFLELHPFETPCFLELPIADGNLKYLNWLKDSLS